MDTLIVVCGSRTFNDKEYIRVKLNGIYRKYGSLLIRQGGAVGADHCAKLLCNEEVWLKNEKTFKPRYSVYSRGAPLKRNIQMVETKPIPKLVVAFYDGVKTSGSSHMINQAKKRGIKTIEFYGHVEM